MRKVFILVVFLLSVGLRAYAIDYNEARQRAWFLTDKMAYELNLSNEQCDLVYEINLDYFLKINDMYDIEGNYWHYRNTDLRYVLLDWQYSLYCNTSYFYLPVAWESSSWHYPIYQHYETDLYYFDRPIVYVSYRGVTTPRGNNDMGPYYNRSVNYTRGMRDLYEIRHSRSHHGDYTAHRRTYRDGVTLPYSLAEPRSRRSRPSGERIMNATRTQRSQMQGNIIPPLRTEGRLRTGTSLPRVGRSSSTRVTVNLGHRED